MTTAIICSKYSINTALLASLAKATSGKLLKVIGSSKKVDLAQYSKVIIVHQYSLSSYNKEFTKFLDNNNDLKHATLVIDIPEFFIEKNPDWRDRTNELILGFNNRYEKEARATVANVENLKESDQRKYAEELGVDFSNTMSENILSKYSAVVVFNAKSEVRINVSDMRANLYVMIGALAVPIGVAIFYYGAKYSLPGSWVSFNLVIFGPILMYVAYRGKRFAHWGGDRGNNDLPLHLRGIYAYSATAAKSMYFLAYSMFILQTIIGGAAAIVYFTYTGDRANETLWVMIILLSISMPTAIFGSVKAGKIQNLYDSGKAEGAKVAEQQGKRILYMSLVLYSVATLFLLMLWPSP
ncbi:MAG: hypothetical protein FWG96_00530 [Methanomassiliicoccaceae archaeon]|nr:hypothetical protein [Methanomassiliicoccaceae archaeon]